MSGRITNALKALSVPWQTNYCTPLAMAITGVTYALRGYEVGWSEPTFDGQRNPSGLTYVVFTESEERVRSHGVEPRCVLPDSIVRAEHEMRQAVRLAHWRLLLARRQA